MKPKRRFTINLDSIAGLVIGFLLLSIALTLWFGSQIGIRVTAELPVDNVIGPFDILTFNFSEPVDGSLAIERFSIQPALDGSFKFDDSKTLQFIPLAPFQPDTLYRLTFNPGVLSQNGRLLKKEFSWSVSVRAPRVVYLVAEEGISRLWTVEPESGSQTPLTDDSFKIFDFDTSHNGEFVIFSAINEQQGLDLWRVGREGGNPILLLQCGADRCSVPTISPSDQRVAYVREAAGASPDLQYGAPRIWVLDLGSKQNATLYEDQQIIGHGPVWSPDGTWLSSYDGLADEIRLLNLATGNQLIIPSQTGSPVTWSADSNTFVFTDIGTNEFGLYTRIRQANLISNEIVTMFGNYDERDYRYNSLAWSPAIDLLVIGLQFEENNPAKALWLMDPVSLEGMIIANQPDYTYHNPQWDPWGNAIIFPQFKLKGVYKPEFVIWIPGMDEPRILAEGIMPHWLP